MLCDNVEGVWHCLYAYRYTRQVLNESLRVSCLAPMAARVDHEESQILGYTIPPGTPVVHALGVSLTDPDVWKDPEL